MVMPRNDFGQDTRLCTVQDKRGKRYTTQGGEERAILNVVMQQKTEVLCFAVL